MLQWVISDCLGYSVFIATRRAETTQIDKANLVLPVGTLSLPSLMRSVSSNEYFIAFTCRNKPGIVEYLWQTCRVRSAEPRLPSILAYTFVSFRLTLLQLWSCSRTRDCTPNPSSVQNFEAFHIQDTAVGSFSNRIGVDLHAGWCAKATDRQYACQIFHVTYTYWKHQY